MYRYVIYGVDHAPICKSSKSFTSVSKAQDMGFKKLGRIGQIGVRVEVE